MFTQIIIYTRIPEHHSQAWRLLGDYEENNLHKEKNLAGKSINVFPFINGSVRFANKEVIDIDGAGCFASQHSNDHFNEGAFGNDVTRSFMISFVRHFRRKVSLITHATHRSMS